MDARSLANDDDFRIEPPITKDFGFKIECQSTPHVFAAEFLQLGVHMWIDGHYRTCS